jgi:hypothetical protein
VLTVFRQQICLGRVLDADGRAVDAAEAVRADRLRVSVLCSSVSPYVAGTLSIRLTLTTFSPGQIMRDINGEI